MSDSGSDSGYSLLLTVGDSIFDYQPDRPHFNYYRRQLLEIQDAARPPNVPPRSPSLDEDEPDCYPDPFGSPESPTSIASMDLESMAIGQRGFYEEFDRTPARRRSRSHEPSVPRLSVHTPNHRIFHNVHTSLTPAYGNAPTPHAMAARRALEQRRQAMFTPGHSRRHSFREQRETPMNVLRNLGRALAPTTNVIDSSSSPDKPSSMTPAAAGYNGESSRMGGSSIDDDELPIDRPRLSLPLDDGSSDEILPPYSSILDDATLELPRRATSEGPPREHRPSSIWNHASNPHDILWDNLFGGGHVLIEPSGNEIHIAPVSMGDPQVVDTRIPVEDSIHSQFHFDMPEGLDDDDYETFYMQDPVIDDLDSILKDPGDDAHLLRDKSLSLDGLLEHSHVQQDESQLADFLTGDFHKDGSQQGDFPIGDVQQDDSQMGDLTQGDVQQDDQQQQQKEKVPFDYGFPDLGDFVSVSSLGDAEMEAVTKIEPGVPLGYVPPRPDEDVIGYRHGRPRKKKTRVSRRNIEHPPLPSTFVRQVAQAAMQTAGLGNQRIPADALEALTQASDWYFEQLGDDLSAYANHANRRTIEERDVIALMNRQRVLDPEHSLFHLANRHLPRELQQMLRCAVPAGQPGEQAAQTAQTGEKRKREDENHYEEEQQRQQQEQQPEAEEEEEEDDEEEELVYPEDDDYEEMAEEEE